MSDDRRHFENNSQAHLTVPPQAGKIVWDFRDNVAVLGADGARANFWMATKHLLTQLFQLGMVTVKEEMSPELFGALRRVEAAVYPMTVSLSCSEKIIIRIGGGGSSPQPV